MLQRCYNPNNLGYASSAVRGIKVCQQWEESFSAFLQDVGYAPTKQHSIDRIDNNGHYEPGNVRWALPVQQSRNMRTNRLVTFDGKTATVSEWAQVTGISAQTLTSRLNRWTVEEALSTPVVKPSNRHTVQKRKRL